MESILEYIFDLLTSFFWKKEMEITMVGIGFTGKTSFLDVISTGSFSEDTAPTYSVDTRKFRKRNVTIKTWDISGSPKNRELWKTYCRGTDVIIYVVDASNERRLKASTDELHQLLEEPELNGIPVLVLGNKNEIPNALTDEDLLVRMNLSAIEDRKINLTSISCKEKGNIKTAIKWITSHSKPASSRSSFYYKI